MFFTEMFGDRLEMPWRSRIRDRLVGDHWDMATDCRRNSRSEVWGIASAKAESWTLMWFSNSKAQINMAVLPLFKKGFLYNVEINMYLTPIAHTHQLKS